MTRLFFVFVILVASLSMPQVSWAKDPGRAKQMYNLGLSAVQRGDGRAAITYFRRAIQYDKDFADAFFQLGSQHARLGDYRSAVTFLGQASRLDPTNSEADRLYNQCRAQIGLGAHHTNQPLKPVARARDRLLDVRSANRPVAGSGPLAQLKTNLVDPRLRAYNEASPDSTGYSSAQDNQTIAAPSVTPPQYTNDTVSFATPPVVPQVKTPEVVERTTASSTRSTDAPVKDKWALVIGISKFQRPEYNLAFATKDALDFYNFLITEAGFKKDHVKLLTDEQATRSNIMSAFGSSWLPRLTEKGDLVVVYVSTHGTPADVDNGGRNYLVAYDTDANDLYPTGVDMDEIYRRIKEGVETDRVLIVLDTCYSGNAVPGSRALSRYTNFDVSKIKLGSGHLVISSSSPGERSWESKRYKNGVFTRQLIEALKGKHVDVNTAFQKLKHDVEWEVKVDHGKTQTPQLGGDWQGSELIISVPASNPRSLSPQ